MHCTCIAHLLVCANRPVINCLSLQGTSQMLCLQNLNMIFEASKHNGMHVNRRGKQMREEQRGEYKCKQQKLKANCVYNPMKLHVCKLQ